MRNFEYYTPTQVLFGKDTHLQAGSLLKKYGAKKVLIHYGGQSAVRSGLIDEITSNLKEEGLEYITLGGVIPNPLLSKVREGIELCQKEHVDFILAVGGGSVIDSSKAIGYGVANPNNDVWDFCLKKAVPTGCLPIGVILTIAASGSEMSSSSVITNEETKEKREITVVNEDSGETRNYVIPYGSRIKVVDGQELEAGDELTEGSVNPHDLLKIKGIRAVQDYMLREVQRVYRLQGVDICDKHIEVIVRQMLKKIRIEESGDTEYLPGTMVDVLDYEDLNEELIAAGKKPAEGKQVMLGITKAALATNSFLSAASFQETTKVLTEAAIKGKADPLIGLKENVIIGKLIPAGTGMKRYRNVKLNTDAMIAAEEAERAARAEEEARLAAEATAAEKKSKEDDELLEETTDEDVTDEELPEEEAILDEDIDEELDEEAEAEENGEE